MNIEEQGFAIEKCVLKADTIANIKRAVAAFSGHYPKHGIRNADKKFSTINELAHSPELLEKAQSLLGGKVELVRVIFFDKTPQSNWLVSWHQDKTIAVNDKRSIEGWGTWSVKDGVHHVQPDLAVLNQMITFRLHLDDCNQQNGCLKVIPKSHSLGILSGAECQQLGKTEQPHFCEVLAGDMVIMKPHILHASSKSTVDGHRRVVHIEYSSYQLPDRLCFMP